MPLPEKIHDAWMGLALAEAHRALATEDVPIGAVVIGPDGGVLGSGRNQREELGAGAAAGARAAGGRVGGGGARPRGAAGAGGAVGRGWGGELGVALMSY